VVDRASLRAWAKRSHPKLKLIVTTAIVGTVLALPSVSSAAPPSPPPTQDSVFLTEGPARFGDFAVTGLSATSGPSGENPTGQVILAVAPTFTDFGPVTCLAVSGNIATLNFDSEVLLGEIVTVQVVDDNPDTISYLFGRAASDCSPLPATNIFPLSRGDITVTDAQPLLPISKDACKHGGWRNFAQFKNQGQCIAFVNHGP
jgi:hypothetical protein